MFFNKSQSGAAKAAGKGNDSRTVDERIASILGRGVEEIFVRESLEAKLRGGKKLRVKLGFDPTGDRIHIGRAITLWKLREFQDLGHEIVFIIGDFTARIGDPSDKLEKRPMLDAAQIKKNLKTYKEQVGKIIDLRRAKFYFNSEWLAKLSFEDVTKLAESFSVQQMSARRNFKDRFEKGIEISLREFLYPLMQGYDSVAVKADVEIGGFDQLFNLKAGRTIQKFYGMPEQDVLTTKMLVGTDGRKMSTSWGNVINITDEAGDMFGKVMSVRDDLIHDYFALCTRATDAEIARVDERMKAGENPRDIKIDLAKAIVALYWGNEAADRAAAQFVATFSEKKIPDDIPTAEVSAGVLLVDVLLEKKIVESKTEFRRLVDEKAISHADSGEIVSDPKAAVQNDMTLRVGKRRFIKISVKK